MSDKVNGNRKFVFDEDQMFKKLVDSQGQSKEEAAEEIIQNALDSDASIIKINVYDRGMDIIDNGIGMDIDTIINYFERIGSSSKSDDPTKIGKHGIGFLKLMKYGRIIVRTSKFMLIIDVDKQGRDYNIIQMKHDFSGTLVSLKYYNKYIEKFYFYTDGLINKIKKIILVTEDSKQTVYINSKRHLRKIKYKHSDFKNAGKYQIFIEDGKSCLYGQGLLINRYLDVIGGYSINCLNKMPLDFGRKGLVDSPEKDDLNKLIKQLEMTWIKKHKRFDETISEKITNKILDGEFELNDIIKEKKIIKLTNGKSISYDDLSKFENVYFDKKGSKYADAAILLGLPVIDKKFEKFIRNSFESNDIGNKCKGELPNEVMEKFNERVINAIDEILKAKTYKIYLYAIECINQEVFNGKRRLEIGQSETYEAWTDGKSYIVINKNKINKRRVFEEICTDIFHTLCHEYAHNKDSLETMEHTADFYERYHEISKSNCIKFGQWMGANRWGKIAKLYDSTH